MPNKCSHASAQCEHTSLAFMLRSLARGTQVAINTFTDSDPEIETKGRVDAPEPAFAKRGSTSRKCFGTLAPSTVSRSGRLHSLGCTTRDEEARLLTWKTANLWWLPTFYSLAGVCAVPNSDRANFIRKEKGVRRLTPPKFLLSLVFLREWLF